MTSSPRLCTITGSGRRRIDPRTVAKILISKNLLAFWMIIAYVLSRNLQLPILTWVSHVGGGSHGHHTVAMALFWETLLKICYIDEAGELGQLGDPPRQNDQPVLVVGGLC